MRNDVALELFYDGAWRDLTADSRVLSEQPITILRGDGAESSGLRPAQLSCRLLDDDDRFRPSNPESPLYGLTGRNTPIRVKVAGVVRATCQAAGWRSDESDSYRPARNGLPKRGKAWTDVEAGGLLEQIAGWTEPLRSPMVRHTLSLPGLVGFWPLEDPRDTVRFSQLAPVAAKPGGSFGEPVFGEEDRPGGATSTVRIPDTGAGAIITGRFAPSTASGWQITFAVHITATRTAAYREIFRWVDSRARVWAWESNDGNFAWRIYDTDGSTIAYTSAPYTLVQGGWVRCRVKATVSGGTLTYEPAWYEEGDETPQGTTLTFASTTTGTLRSWRVDWNPYTAGGYYCTVYGLDDPTVDLISDLGVLLAFNGHRGETPARRFLRLMDEHDLTGQVIGDADTGAPMGVQPAEPLEELLREVRDTDDALMFDAVDAVSVVMLTGDGRYNRTATVVDVDELPARPREITDNQGVHNIVTIANRDGAEFTARDDTGPLGTAATPTGVGPKEGTVDVNVDDVDTLDQHAAWWLNRFTVDLPRYPSAAVNLAPLDAARVAQIEAVDVGDVLEITGYRPDPIRLTVIGYTEKIGWPNARTIVFVCVPDQQRDVGTYDDRRYGLRTCTMAAAAGPTATTLTLAITADEQWSQTSTYDLLISGERVTVPAGGMSARSGTPGAYTQTITGAVRTVNGVRKTLPAGAGVQIAPPGRWAR